MKESVMKLHVNRKRALYVIVLFSLFSFLLNAIIAVAINDDLVELNSLKKSDYVYSAVIHKSVAKDDYYMFNAGISFATSADSKASLNAEVIMQSASSAYTDAVYWNAKDLSQDEVAVSRGIASTHDLQTGDKLYSKHNVDGLIHEYTIVQILPDAIHVRVTDQNGFYSGIIIMGYDDSYVNNITHTWIVFTDQSVEKLSRDQNVIPEKLVYRGDEIIEVLKSILPYAAILIVMSALAVIVMTVIISNDVSYNFRRLMILGFNKHGLDGSYRNVTYGIEILSIFTASLLSIGFFFILDICLMAFMLLCCVVFVEILVLWIVSAIMNRRLWRR